LSILRPPFPALILALAVSSPVAALNSASAPTVLEDNPYSRLDWVLRHQLPQEMQDSLPSFCSGAYLPPKLVAREDESIEVNADNALYHEVDGAVFTGNVLLEQKDRRISGHKATYNKDTGAASFQGNEQGIQFRADQITMVAERLDYNANTGEANLYDAEYAITERHMRGQAERLQIRQEGVAVLETATYTFCEPGHNDWDVRASEIELDQNEGWGEAYHTRLRIQKVPVFYFPYYRFPISDKRLTGFLDPTLDLDIQGKDVETASVAVKEFAAPFYINIAPNYDDTLTPRFVRDHGLLWGNEFRYLNILGEGSITATYLGDDLSNEKDEASEDFRQAERWSKAVRHSGKIGQYWSHRVHYDEVSDIDYTDDFRQAGSVSRASHLQQKAEFEFNDGNWQLLTLVESSQTVDTSVTDNDKPFRKLPQATFSKLNSYETNQFNYEFTAQATRFTRTNNGLSGVDKINGDRFHTDATISYPLENAWGFVTPKVKALRTEYSFNNLDDSVEADYREQVTRNISTSSLDAGIYLEREFDFFSSAYVQTLEPRIMYAYTPYVDQSDIPLFDTAESDFSYSRLFNPNRFSGYDRVGDTEQVTLGLTTRFINEGGNEVLRGSLGQILFFADRKVELNPGDVTLEDENRITSSAFAGEIEWNLSSDLRFNTSVQYNPRVKATTFAQRQAGASEERIEKATAQLSYRNERNWIVDVNFNHVEEKKEKQLGAAFFAPITDRWAFFGQQKRDIWPYRSRATRELKDEENTYIIEGLGGIEYQNCCWRVQLSYEEHTKSDSTKDYQFLMQFHLKGLGIFGRQTDVMLGERIYGYDQRVIHDY